MKYFAFLLQRLKAAVHYTVGCLCEEVASDREMPFSKQTIAAISELTFRQCGMKPGPPSLWIKIPQVALPGKNVWLVLPTDGEHYRWVLFMKHPFSWL